MPQRIQRKRTSGWRANGARIVDRTTGFGNPFTVAEAIEHGFADDPDTARAICAAEYRRWLQGDEAHRDAYKVGHRTFDRRWVRAHLPELAGRDLACTCPLPAPGHPDHCHAAVLIRLANP